MNRLLAGDDAEEECLGEAPPRLALRVFRAGESAVGGGERIGDFFFDALRVFLAGELAAGGTGDFFLGLLRGLLRGVHQQEQKSQRWWVPSLTVKASTSALTTREL